MKFRRENADNRVGHVIQRQRLAERRTFAAEMVLEEGVAQDHDMTLRRVRRGGIKTGPCVAPSRRRE